MKVPIQMIFGLLFIMFGCGSSDDPSEKIVLPSNLVVDVAASTDGSGKVNVHASADNANFYTIGFGSSGTGNTVTSNDGKASFVYAESGTYTIIVQAHTTSAKFIETKENVTVTKTPTDPLPDF